MKDYGGKSSKRLYDLARESLVGGVNSPVRAFAPYPWFVHSGSGARLKGVDGREFVDFVLGYGPLVLGHAPPEVVEALVDQVARGTVFGAPTELEVEYARTIRAHVPGAERVRCVSTGAEATACAIRLARAVKEKDVIVKFDGGFHGAHDAVMVKGGSGMATHGVPNSNGVPKSVASLTRVIGFNDEAALDDALKNEDVAAVIAEPVMANIGVIPPKTGFLKKLRAATQKRDALLIFDEIVTGFRLAMGGAQEFYDVRADIVTLGKIAGGGMPIGVVAGPETTMSHLSPEGDVYNAGTFNGNPMSMAAGIAAMKVLESGRVHPHIAKLTELMARGLYDAIDDRRESDERFQACANAVTGMLTMFYAQSVKNADGARGSDAKRYLEFHRKMMEDSFWLPPSQFEAWFVSAAHTPEDVERFCEAAAEHI